MENLSKSNSSPKLPLYERAAACILIIFILFLIALNFYLDEGQFPQPTGEPRYLVKPYIEVTVTGAVERPGIYQVRKGTLVEEVIHMARPLDKAKLDSIKLDSKIVRRRAIHIRENSKLNVAGQPEKISQSP
jgi:hypothetical protein